MKKITLTLFVSLFFLSLMAQKEVTSINSFKAPFSIDNSKSTDTLVPPSYLLPCFDTLTLYGATSFGYCTGNNSFGDLEKAQKYIVTGSGTISAVLVYALAKSTTGTSTVKIYDINATTKAPNNALGLPSNSVANSAVVVGNLTPYTFATPVSFTGNFATSMVLPTGATDTLVVVSTKNNCYSNDSLSWEKESDNAWYSIVHSWTSGGVGLKIDLVMFPVVQVVVGMTPIAEDNLMSIYPNPTNDVVTIAAVNKVEKINIYNTIGQLVRAINPNDNILKIDVSDLQHGLYIMQVQTEKGIVSRSINVQ